MTCPARGNSGPYFPAVTGQAILTGAAPGDTELQRLSALRSLQSAEVVAFPPRVSDGMLVLIPQSAKRIAAGKRSGRPDHCRDGINRLLIREAGSGQRVVRLKGGDPLILGRGGKSRKRIRPQVFTAPCFPELPPPVAAPPHLFRGHTGNTPPAYALLPGPGVIAVTSRGSVRTKRW